MNYYAFIPLAAFLINFFTFIYILALKRKNSVNRAYMLVVLSFSGLSMSSFVQWSSLAPGPWIHNTMKGVSIFWLSFGFTFLNFTYALLRKKKETIYYMSLASVAIFYTLAITTNLVVSGFEQYFWGYYEVGGPLFVPSALITVCLPFIYSIFMIVQERSHTSDKHIKKQLNLVVIGASSLVAIAVTSDIIFMRIFDIFYFFNISTVGTIVQSLFIFRAVKKHNFLSIGIKEVAQDLFTNVIDSVILIDNNKSIIQINNPAKYMFGIQNIGDDFQLPFLFEDYDFNKDYRHYETHIYTQEVDTVVSLSQATVKQYGVELGKLIIIRDITESKRAEEALRQSRIQLEALADKLAQTNHVLEHKIAERTASLQVSNNELRQQIAKRTWVEAARADEQERLSVTLSSIGDGVIIIDTTGHVTLLNRVAEQLTGWPQHRAVGQPLGTIFRLLDGQKRVPRTTAVEEALQSTKIVNRTHLAILISQSATEYSIAESGAPIRAQDGTVIGAVLVFRDMTERQKIEEELIKADRLESLGMAAGGIAHDFNNILTAIMGNISLARRYAKEDDKVSKRLDNAEKASLRAQDLAQQLLTFAKDTPLLKRLVSIKSLIQESVDCSLQGSNVRCELALDDDLWSAEVDSGQISQVMHNLIINANQAMPNGGILGVRAENVIVDEGSAKVIAALKPGCYVKIIIEDEGCGIPEDRLQKSFDPYFTTKGEGSGLGLFTTYSIIKKHDGYIDVTSAVDIGTTFRVYLPAAVQALDASASVGPGLASGSGKVLVMENEAELCDVIEGILLHFGYDMVFVGDGIAAISAYQHAKDTQAPFDAVIMDLTIPGGMGGKEAIKRLLELDPEVKAIVASGYANDPIMADYRAYGFVGCITKPYRTETLHKIMREVIG